MAGVRKQKHAEEDRLTDANIARIIGLLNPTEDDKKAITKKEACAALGIAYNTTRLQSIIDNYLEKLSRDRKRRQEKRGKPATPDEVGYVVTEYLRGECVDHISKSLYRSPNFVKTVLEQYHVPTRNSHNNYFNPELIPDGAVRDRFAIGETVYSSRYDSLALIKEEKPHHTYGYVYLVWLLSDEWQQYAWLEACECASLEHLRELGVQV